MDRFWRTVAHRLKPLPHLARVTIEHGVCFEETFFELVSKFPSTARIRLIGSRDATIWQSYARQIPSNVTRLTLFDAGCYSIDLGIMLPRFAMLPSIDLNSPTLAMCTELANLSHRTALTRLCNPQGLEQATLGLLGKFPRLHTLAGLSLGEALDVAQVTVALHSTSGTVCFLGQRDRCACAAVCCLRFAACTCGCEITC